MPKLWDAYVDDFERIRAINAAEAQQPEPGGTPFVVADAGNVTSSTAKAAKTNFSLEALMQLSEAAAPGRW